MICVIGCKGNMGRRYMSILKHLKIRHVGVDFDEEIPYLKKITHYIVATPTNTHFRILDEIWSRAVSKAYILIEKPCFQESEKDKFLETAKIANSFGHNIYMVNNYQYYPMLGTNETSLTYYDFYHSGTDGIEWDCIQLIHLAKGEIFLSNESPYWRCQINGKPLQKDLMDLTYIEMIKDFNSGNTLYGQLWGINHIEAAHNKVIGRIKNET